MVFTIPFEDDIRIVPNILIGILFVLLPFVEKKLIRKLILNKSYLIAITLIFFIALSSLIIETISNDFYIIKKLFILIAVLVLSLPIKKDSHLLFFFILSVALGNIISIVNIGNYILDVGSFEIDTGQKINDLLIIERLYFGFINSLSVVFSLKIWVNSIRKYKILLVLSILLSVFMLFLVASRMAIISVLIIFMIKIFYHTNLKKSLIAVVIILATITGMFVLNDNLAKRFLYVDKKNDFFYKIREWEPRYVIWKCGFSHVNSSEHKLLLGDGFNQTQQNLNDCYIISISKKDRLEFFLKTRFNTHNQYLDLLLSKGIIGLALFLFLIYRLSRDNIKNINQLNILLVIVLFALIENLLHRQIGVYLFALVLIVLTIKKSEDNILDE